MFEIPLPIPLQQVRDEMISADISTFKDTVSQTPKPDTTECSSNTVRGYPLMMSTKFSDFLTPSPLTKFGNDLYHKIHASFP